MKSRMEIIELHKKQLALEIQSIRLSIQHKAAKGSEAENAFRRLIRKHLPQRYKLGSGFVVNADKISHQHDVIIYDDFLNAPMYSGDTFGSFLGGAVYGVLETTIGKFGSGKLEEDIKKIADLRKMFPEGRVAFQKVISCPIVDQEKLKEDVGNCLSSGCSIDDIWSEMKEKCISQDGAFVGDVNDLTSMIYYDKKTVAEMIDWEAKYSKRNIVQERVIYSAPPPRTYLCALDGTAYKSVNSLAKAVKRLTMKYGTHIHGLLVLNKEGQDWLLSTQAFMNYEVQIITDAVFFKFLENMKQAFQGMLVGKYPAADVHKSEDV